MPMRIDENTPSGRSQGGLREKPSIPVGSPTASALVFCWSKGHEGRTHQRIVKVPEWVAYSRYSKQEMLVSRTEMFIGETSHSSSLILVYMFMSTLV